MLQTVESNSSYTGPNLKNIYNMPHCCSASADCCATYFTDSTPLYPPSWYNNTTLLTILCPFLLVLFMLGLSMLGCRRNNVLPLYKRDLSGPFSSTRVGTRGFILPSIAYHSQLVQKERNKDSSIGAPQFVEREEILNAMKLLEMSEDKLIDVVVDEVAMNSRKQGLHNLEIIQKPTPQQNHPLPPAYYPTRRVSMLWEEDIKMEELYRYKNLSMLVYPPGYVHYDINPGYVRYLYL